LVLPDTFYLDESGSGSGLFSEVGSGSGPNRSGSATLVVGKKNLGNVNQDQAVMQ
jgi:hypothetical protein